VPSWQVAYERSFLLLRFYFSVFTKDRVHKGINPEVPPYVIRDPVTGPVWTRGFQEVKAPIFPLHWAHEGGEVLIM
jgi:hypothetical protein